MWIGFSFLHFFSLIESVIERVVSHMKKRKKTHTISGATGYHAPSHTYGLHSANLVSQFSFIEAFNLVKNNLSGQTTTVPMRMCSIDKS